jgi:hypothetical protein
LNVISEDDDDDEDEDAEAEGDDGDLPDETLEDEEEDLEE